MDTPIIIGHQPVGRRIDSVTMAMIDTYMKSYEGIDAKYDKLKQGSVTASRVKLRDTLAAIPQYERTTEEEQMLVRLYNSDISIYKHQEDKFKEYDEVSEKIRKLVEDAVLHKFIRPFDREHEYMYVQRVYMARGAAAPSPYETLWLEGPMLRVNGVGHKDQAVVANFHYHHTQLTLISIVGIETIEKDFKDYCGNVMSNIDIFKVLCGGENE
ncbi:hypothetical protein [Fibrobacter sp.]|uniref:hypothetical protein n=1 Tax=Fibrobacter sp. TaxID=35828 RepID=UPI003863585E